MKNADLKAAWKNQTSSQTFRDHFMGYGDNQVPFLGHGIGLAIDEWPVIAAKMEAPLAESTVIALEPKKALPGIGMVGIENTFRVTEQGGRKLNTWFE